MTQPVTMLRAATVAERWDVPLSTVYRWCKTGKLSCRRIGGVVRIPLAAVLAIEEG